MTYSVIQHSREQKIENHTVHIKKLVSITGLTFMKAKDAKYNTMSISINHQWLHRYSDWGSWNRSHIYLIFFSLQVNLDNSSQSATPAAFFIYFSNTFPYSWGLTRWITDRSCIGATTWEPAHQTQLHLRIKLTMSNTDLDASIH